MTIATMRSSLTQDDIRRLVRGDSPEARSNAAHKICRRIDTMEMSEGDKESARQVLDLMCNDTAVLVRRALAVTLRNSPKLPRDIALKLARDVDAIAVPVLKNSPGITDEDLVEIVLAGAAEKQVAIAQRASLGEGLTEVIALYAAKPAVEACTLNEGATFSDDAFAGLLKRFANDNEIKGALVSRNALPIHVTEKLVNMVTGELFDHELIER